MKRIIFAFLTVILIIYSCKLKETPTETEEPTITIKVLSPNGDETVPEGSTWEVKWNADNVASVRIQFTTDNGFSWGSVVDSTKNTGTYNWFPVPNKISNQCKIRVSTLDGQASDLSDKVFSIVKNTNESLRITTPVGKEAWEAGTSKQIKWYSSGIDSVRIEYTTNNGQKWNLIGIDKKNTGVFTWSPIPNTPSTLSKVRISDAKDGFPSTESTDPFEILPEASIAVVSPNGGEELNVGTSASIKWQSVNIENVKIEYTSNGGASWNLIIASTESDGLYIWSPVPSIFSLQCKVRISDASDSVPFDISDNNFSIITLGSQTIKVNSPNGEEKWAVGSSQDITWEALGIANVKIEYTVNNGISWNVIVASTPSTGIYTWSRIPNTLSTNCRVRVSDAADGLPFDESDKVFSIVSEATIKVLSPNGGEELTTGSSTSIKWNSTNVENVRIEYSINGGATWITIVSSTESDGLYIWSPIPAVSSLQCKIRISDAVLGSPSDVSDENFSIVALGSQLIRVTSPNGGQKWPVGSSQNITWEAAGIANVKIELTVNNGISWTTIVASTPSTGVYNWQQIPNTLSSNCKIRISDMADGSPIDDSDAPFAIIPEPSIKVLSPNGGEIFYTGSSKDIKWTSESVENVEIEFSVNGGATWTTIVSSTPSVGIYTWNSIPNLNSLQCKIRISDAGTGNPSDVSDANFTITNQIDQTIQITTPKGGEKWQAGTTRSITWNSQGINAVNLDFTTNGGLSWNSIVRNYTNSGTYDWIIPTINSTQCKIRISDAADNIPTVESGSVFTIKPLASLSFTQPITGTEIFAGDRYTVRWNSSGIDYVRVQLNTKNTTVASDWVTIADSIPNNNQFETTFNIVSDNNVLRIIDPVGGTEYYYSGVFKVKPAPSISVTSPNGGEELHAGTSSSIRWKSTNIENVKIEYTSNGGATWNLIVASTPS
ncbi:MAG: hypothetical protein FJ214_08555, partial [Ignavibacteria bacterium]|nr:hypothetical protein [Ignavibacteria bacterium]